MFYWGLLIGLIIGANIGLIVAGLFSRHKKDERAALWTQDACDWVDTQPVKTKKPSPKKTESPHPSE